MRLTRRPLCCSAFVLCVVLAGAVPSVAHDGGGGKDQRGSCSGGPEEWRLSVDRRDGGRLRVRFRIEEVPVGQSWQVFLSDNGSRIFTGTRKADSRGEVHVTKITKNRPGSDRIAASGVGSASGATCSGAVTF